MRIKNTITGGYAICMLVAGAVNPLAVTDVHAQASSILSYAAKFVCGPRTSDVDVLKGMYATTINIHNPQFVAMQFSKKAVIALAERSTTRGQISNRRSEMLLPDEAMGVDCTDIKGLFTPPIGGTIHIEGFLVIEVPATPTGAHPELDVVGKYTARHRNGAGGVADVTTDVESLEIVPYSGKIITVP